MARSYLFCFLLFGLPWLAGCAALPSYSDIKATAVAGGCWPGSWPTPAPLTVTPASVSIPIAAVATPTHLPTTTPYPRCPAAPGTTQVPWPTPVPNPPPYPTMIARPWQTGADQQTTLLLPGTVIALDVATHPTEDWAAVASVVWSGNDDPDRVIVSVLNPHTAAWSPARQVDLAPAQIGRYSRTVAVTITGDSTVSVAWSMSDPDFRDGDPLAGTWLSESGDFGASWSTPERIATDCRRVDDLAGALDGTLAFLLTCNSGPQTGQPVILVRHADKTWAVPERLPVSVWPYSEGALALLDDGSDTTIIGVAFAGVNGAPVGYAFRRLLSGSSVITRVALEPTGQSPSGLRMGHVQALRMSRVLPDGQHDEEVALSWASLDADRPGLYAMVSRDAGRSWSAPEVIQIPPPDQATLFAPLAYDPAADRLVAILTCCADAGWDVVPSTHYARWSVPGSGFWQLPAPDDPPLALGSRVASITVTAQPANSRRAWVAWVEQQQRIEVRTLALNQVIPVDQYPVATPGGQP